MEVVESKKITTKFGNKVNLVIRAGSMTARNQNKNIPQGYCYESILLSSFKFQVWKPSFKSKNQVASQITKLQAWKPSFKSENKVTSLKNKFQA